MAFSGRSLTSGKPAHSLRLVDSEKVKVKVFTLTINNTLSVQLILFLSYSKKNGKNKLREQSTIRRAFKSPNYQV